MPTSNNIHITRYLDYYLALKNSPEFAILLRGNWGSGKSWYVKNYIKRHKPEQFLYVSLYGVGSYSEIEDSFFEQIHPVLASKGMKIAGKILKGAIKTTLKISFDDAKKDEISLAGGIPDIRLPEYLKKLDGKAIVFDDFERCALPIYQILGYINQYVENSGLKVIIVANEDEIIETDEKNSRSDDAQRYLTIKEKLIGKSFDVQSDYHEAFEEFVKKLESPSCRKYVKRVSYVALLLFNTAGFGNLRHLKQTLLDFERFYRLLDKKIIECGPLMEHLFSLFLIISFELKKGAIHENNIPDFFSLNYLVKKSNERNSNVESIKAKYPIFTNYAFHPLTQEIWTELFRTGDTDKNELNKQLFDSNYFARENTPLWQQLYYFESLEDDQFKQLQDVVYQQLIDGKFINPYFVIQAAGILVFLADANLNSFGISHLLKLATDNLNTIKANRGLDYQRFKNFPGDHSHGLGYAAKGVAAFDAFLISAAELVVRAEKDDWPKRANVLLGDLKKNPKRFCSKLDFNLPSEIAYTQAPVLAYIDHQAFVEQILVLSNKDMRTVFDAIEARYNYGYSDKLAEEASWLTSIINDLDIKAKSSIGPVKGYIITSKIIPALSNISAKIR